MEGFAFRSTAGAATRCGAAEWCHRRASLDRVRPSGSRATVATNYLLRPDLAGGAMLDNGCYPVAVTRRIAGQASEAPIGTRTTCRGWTARPGHGHRCEVGGVAVVRGRRQRTGALHHPDGGREGGSVPPAARDHLAAGSVSAGPDRSVRWRPSHHRRARRRGARNRGRGLG